MIEIPSTDQRSLTLLGRYVLVDEQLAYPSLGRPLLITGVQRGMLVGVEPARHFVDDDQGGHYELDGPDEALPPGTIRDAGGKEARRQLTAVRCVCDTPAEVNAVLRHNGVNRRAYQALCEDAGARLRALTGEGLPAHEPSRPGRRPR